MNYVRDGLTDDSDFLHLLNRLVAGLLSQSTPEVLWIIQIDNWFDHKWLKFSGTGSVASGLVSDRFDSVKTEFFKEAITFPPFSPNRILGQWSYEKGSAGYTEAPTLHLPHATEKQRGWVNVERPIRVEDRPTIFVWYSANSLKNARASVMVYDFTATRPNCWFASFARVVDWKLRSTKAVSHRDVLNLVSVDETEPPG